MQGTPRHTPSLAPEPKPFCLGLGTFVLGCSCSNEYVFWGIGILNVLCVHAARCPACADVHYVMGFLSSRSTQPIAGMESIASAATLYTM